MEDEKRAIKVSTLDELAEGFQESRGITDKLTMEQMIAFAKEPVGGGKNKLAQFVDGTLTEVTAEDLEGITNIGDFAFYHKNNLISITIPKNIKSIGKSAFYGCNSLARVNIDDIVSWCNIILNREGVVNPMNYAKKAYFKNSLGEYELLTNLVIPNTVKSISYQAFYECDSLISVTLPEGFTDIGAYAFQGCDELISVNFPSTLLTIGRRAFHTCKKFKLSSDFPDGLTSIGEHAFYDTPLDGEIVIPETVTTLETAAFFKTKITKATIPQNLTEITNRLFCDCTSLVEVNIPPNLVKIDQYAFHGCPFKSIDLSVNTLQTIGEWAFDNCYELTNMIIGAGVTSIGNYALRIGSTTNKATIRFLGTTPPTIQSSTIGNNVEKIIVPIGCGDVYKSATNFSAKADIIEEATE